ncbi:MAG: class I SAM-dependent methyltransferase [Rhodocyclaceae bacterium]|nr:class I SAM-dependent methyltransferase [Rhodocyclaceae bacterium]
MLTDITANTFETGTDEIERFALEECIKRQRADHRVAVMVSPTSQCELAIKFAKLGATVTAVDRKSKFESIQNIVTASGLSAAISCAVLELPAIPDELPNEPFDIIFIRYGLGHLHYEEARQVVRQLMLKLRIGGKLYVSILGLKSELGDGYIDADKDVQERFCYLSPALVKKYGIKSKVCLYTERNLFLLLLESGASVLRTLTTTYGNVKAVAVRV